MHIHIYTDGSCLGNPGPGAWAYLMEVENGSKKEIHRDQDGETHTTNNRMELSAVIEGLKKAGELYPQATQFTVTSDSSWVLNTLTKGWKRKKNLDLWAQLDPLLMGKKIEWKWVKGHNGHPQNEDCDRRAQEEAGRQAKKTPKKAPDQNLAPSEKPRLF